jgi:hypothetical protein
LDAHWAFKSTTYGYELTVTDVSKANKQYTKYVWLHHFHSRESLFCHALPYTARYFTATTTDTFYDFLLVPIFYEEQCSRLQQVTQSAPVTATNQLT